MRLIAPCSFSPLMLTLTLASSSAAQLRPRAEQREEDTRRTAISLLAGPSPYDLNGTGTGFAAALRVDVPVGRVLIVEPGIGFFRYRPTTGSSSISYLLPEVSLQLQAPSRVVRPYIGGGAGFSEFLSGRGSTFATLHAAAGIRLDVGPDWAGRAEARLRSIDPFVGTTTDLLIGLSRRLRGR